MIDTGIRHWRLPARLLGAMAATLALCSVVAGSADTPPPAPGKPADAPPAVLSLSDCLHLAEHNPRLTAARASLAAAEAAVCGLDGLHGIPLFPGAHELPIRRQQAALGLNIAEAGVREAESEVVYEVTRTYYTAAFAESQLRTAQRVVGRLQFAYDRAREGVESGKSRSLAASDVQKVALYLGLARSRQEEAATGVQRALAGLREALGAEACFRFELADHELPYREQQLRVPDLCRDDVVAQALAHRGVIVQVDDLACVFDLEVEAQGTSCLPSMRTFAWGADMHSRLVPEPFWNGEYRPGGIPPEMPPFLAGHRCARQDRARALADRAAAVAVETRHLVTLEVDDTFLKWQEAARRVPLTLQAYRAGREWDKIIEDIRTNPGEDKEKVYSWIPGGTEAYVHAGQAEAAYHEELFRYVIGLAALERVTGGAVCSGLVPPPPPPAPGLPK